MSMKDYLCLGPAPAEEDCQQVGTPSYDPLKAAEECQRYRKQLRKQFGEEPEGASLVIKSFNHDFGHYREVVCFYDEDFPESIEYAFRCEDKAWTTWHTEEATKEEQ